MLHIYKSDAQGSLLTVKEITHNSLLYLENPSAAEIQSTAKTLNIPLDFFEDSLDKNELPRIQKSGQASLIVVNAPVRVADASANDGVPYKTAPIGLIHTQDNLVIVAREKLPFIADLINGKYDDYQSFMKTRISLLLFKAVSQAFDHSLHQINLQVSSLQKKIKSSYHNNELFGLINLNKSLVYFSTSLSAMSILYKRLMEGGDIKIHDEEKTRLNDILIDIQQSAEITEMRRESLSNLMDAYAAIIHNNLNSVLKMLTTLTIVMIIPTMIGSIFSMNVALPYEEEWISTVVISAAMVLISAFLVVLFYKKKYLRL
ncbi:magnesium transporter CorA family protein [Alcaligenes faecalis]|uniref:magnesium transporter CorA family protein n=1 Tax=Alcaligenes faecalis TaxID=511 RepID=UPI001C83D3BF|nr:magnesium transporter CorA family protein [Alcaligenes faecalis]MBX6965034.1 magnesium transporter CorA family protein [Providencia rettgeri]MBX7031672.1 magnesium transporter CorA family protein [Alcaligenes faecalis]